MTTTLFVKTEEGRKIIRKVTNRYIESLQAAPFYWKGNEFIILGTQVEQSIIDAIVDEAGRDFFKYFDISGYLKVGSWLFGKTRNAEDYVRERLGMVDS